MVAEVIPLPAEMKSSGLDDLPRSVHGPGHPCLFQSRSDDSFAAALDSSASDLIPLISEGWVAHAMSVILEIVDRLSCWVVVPFRCDTVTESSENIVEIPVP
jgi:hypothetical protein